jgi:Arc/MetJ-type ribon-helix-helix transcriptional regulator
VPEPNAWSTRISVELPGPLAAKLTHTLPWGLKSEAVRALVRLLIREIDENGLGILDSLLNDTARLATGHAAHLATGHGDQKDET